MNKVLLTLLLVLFLTLLPAGPLRADDNAAPIIEESSLIVQIIDDEGTAFGWTANDGDPNPGDRPLPYILNGEQLYFEIEVTDANGEADLTAMQVRLNLGPGVFFTGSLTGMTIDADAGIYKGRYSGCAMADASIPAGKADITFDVIDSANATDAYDPLIYQPGTDILKPEVSLEVSQPSVTFPQSNAGDLGIAANENPILLTPRAVIGEEHIPVVFSISHYGTDMINGEYLIPVGSIEWSTTPEGTGNSLSTADQTIASGVAEGTVIEVYYRLNVPEPQTDGDYSGTIDYHFIAD
jgi:hypothetical protein